MTRGRGPVRPTRWGVAAALVLAACGDGEQVESVAVDTVGGVERVSYPAEPRSVLSWTVDTVAVIGEAMGTEEYQFGRLAGESVAGDAAGAVVVADREGARVLEYGPDGQHRATYGRRGEGPGEIAFAAGVTVGPGDTVWLNDLMNRRLTGYPRDGGEPRSVPYTRGDIFPGSQVAAQADGFLMVMGAIGPPGESIPEPLLRLDRALNLVDTLWTPPPDPIDVVRMDLGGREVVTGVPRTFWPGFLWRGFSDGGGVVADSAEYVFRILDPDGAVRRIVRRAPAARPTTDTDREMVRDSIRREAEAGQGLWAQFGGPDPETRLRMAEERIEHLTFTDRIPRIADLHVDRSDRIWVGVSEDRPRTVERIDIYDRNGELLGEVRGIPMPVAFTGRDRLMVIRTDELDVPQVVVLRLDRGTDDG
jgi:hypothetical protein